MIVTFNVATVDAYGEPCPTCIKYSSEGYADWWVMGDTAAVVLVPPAIDVPVMAIPEPMPALLLLAGLGALGLRLGRS